MLFRSGVESQNNLQIVKADAPLAELSNYVTTLRTISSGKAVPTVTFSHYEAVKPHVAERIIENIEKAWKF